MKFTDKEISLCKQVAEKKRKVIKYGDWLLNEGGFTKVWPYRPDCRRTDVLPLWTISDCLEFLGEKDWRSYSFSFNEKGGIGELSVVHIPFKFEIKDQIVVNGKTLLEACLKAVLAVLEEGK